LPFSSAIEIPRDDELGTEDERQLFFRGGEVCAHGTRERAFVGDRERAVAECVRGLDQFLRMRGTAQETEIAQAVQLGIVRGGGAGYNAAMRNIDFPALDAPARPWGLAATFGLSLGIWYTLEVLQAAMGTGMEAVLHDFKLVPAEANTQALHFAIITCITTVLCGALVIAAAGLRDGLDPRTYLGLRRVSRAELLRWMIVTVVVVVQTDLVLYLVKGELLPAQWVEVYRSVHSPLLFWIALVVATPIFEELLYRGFVFEGIRASRLGGMGAVLITAMVWTLIYQESDPLEFAMIFIVGLMLGVARLRTGSVLLTIAMHMLHNVIGSAEIAWLAFMTE